MSEQNNQPEQEAEVQETLDQVAEELQGGEELSAEAEIAVLNAELEAAKQTIEEQKDSVVRAAAEVENMRRRTAQDVEKARTGSSL